jgi:HEAT repeat protein
MRRTNHFLAIALVLFIAASCAPTNPWTGERHLQNDPASIRERAAQLSSNDPTVRTAARDAMINQGASALPVLRRFLQTGDEKLHRRSLELIRHIGPDALPLLADMLDHPRVSIRRETVSILIDLAPDTESIQPAICRALRDKDELVARDAARALGALGEKAVSSVPCLIDELSDADEHLRIYAAEALAAIGPAADQATAALSRALRDPIPGVRWAACEALAGIGPAAAPAVPGLIAALRDDFLYVRICAAGALGSIKADSAVGALRSAANDPRLRAEAQWAIHQITGMSFGEEPIGTKPVVRAIDRALPSGNPPLDWDVDTGRNIDWSVELGNDTFGRAVVAGGVD